MHPFVTYALRDASRAWLLRGDAVRPRLEAWSRGRVGVVLGLLLLTWGSVGAGAEILAGYVSAASAPPLAAGGGLLVGIGSLVLGMLAAVAAAGQVLDAEPVVRAWPVPRRLLFVPEIVSMWAQGALLVLLSTAPLAAAWAGAVAAGSPARMGAAALAAVATYVVCAAVFSVLAALALRLSASVTASLSGIVVAVFGLFVGGVVLVSNRLAAEGPAGLERAARAVDAAVGLPVLAALGSGGRLAAWIGAAALVGGGAGLVLASALLEATRERWFAGGGPQAGRTLGLPFGTALEARLGPFLRKDLVIAQREPGIVLRQVLVVGLFLVVLLFGIPDRDRSVLLFVVLTLPASLCGATLLHAVGQEGTLLHMIRVLGAGDRFLASKLAVGLVTVSLMSAGLAALALELVLAPTWTRLGMVLVFVVLASIVDVLLALGLGCIFVDLSVKRMAKDRGVSIPGEILFWTLAGFVSFGFYLVASAAAGGQSRTPAGVLIVLLAAGSSVVLYLRGRAKLSGSS